ncbi:MAG: hypothetical protein Q8S44_01695 [Flavobacteriaceae bacterium]|nr:hypothetical protein [Flavobacteriaceae bacterium]
MSYKFTNFDDKEYFNKSTTSEVKSLIYKIRQDASNSPFLNFDISELILSHFHILNSNYNEKELREIISNAVWYFKKGNKDDVFKNIIDKINLPDKRN